MPRYDYVAQRSTLTDWANAKGEGELEGYRAEKNCLSIDGLPSALAGEA